MWAVLGLIAATYIGLCQADTSASLLVKTQYGLLRGVHQNHSEMFRGIPYAQPPVGELRWHPPLPPKPWSNVRDATEYGPACPQPGVHKLEREDCLTLNIARPERQPAGIAAAGKKAVLVWIHGGGFISGTGSASFFDSTQWNANDIILVTLNYRLGPLGFFAHPAIDLSRGANFALMDMIAALQWVKRNIAAFGGDPERITIMGESAGGMAVHLLMAAPAAEGLFTGAIAQSGYATWPLPRLATQNNAANAAETLSIDAVARAGIDNAESVDADTLRSLDADALVEHISGFQLPIVDGVSLPEEPGIIFARGLQHDVPFISGGNSFDGSVFPYSKIPAAEIRDKLGDAFAAASRLYQADFNHSENRGMERIFGDMRYVHAGYFTSLKMSQLPSAGYFYYFDVLPEDNQQNFPGAPHGFDVHFLFRSSAPMATLMRRYWVNFIKTGNPNGSNLKTWPAMAEKSASAMVFRNTEYSVSPVLPEKLQLLNQIYLHRIGEYPEQAD